MSLTAVLTWVTQSSRFEATSTAKSHRRIQSPRGIAHVRQNYSPSPARSMRSVHISKPRCRKEAMSIDVERINCCDADSPRVRSRSYSAPLTGFVLTGTASRYSPPSARSRRAELSRSTRHTNADAEESGACILHATATLLPEGSGLDRPAVG